MIECDEVECVAGRGIVGDRFFDYKASYGGQITLFAEEVYTELCEKLGVTDKSTSVFRRNVIIEGADLGSLVGVEFELNGVRLRGSSECSPCYWMDRAFAPGAEALLKGRGGLRATILSSGKLRKDLA